MELEKRRERYLFDKVVDRIQIIEQMVEMRDHGKELNPREMELDFMYRREVVVYAGMQSQRRSKKWKESKRSKRRMRMW